MNPRHFQPSGIPYFSFDRALTTRQIQDRLRHPGSPQWQETAAWIMREASFPDVWFFLTPQDVANELNSLIPNLGKKRDFWHYIIGVWCELGRIQSPDAA